VGGGSNSDKIYLMNADGSNQRPLTAESAYDFSPSWSPDGKPIAFVNERAGNAQIFVMNADGSNRHALTHN
jgi:TolB protein